MLKRFWKFWGEYRSALRWSIVFVVLESAVELTIPFIMADLIDVGIANKDVPYIIRSSLLMLLCALLALTFGVLFARTAAKAGYGFGANLREAEFEKVQSFSFSNQDNFSTSSLVTRLTSDVNNIQNTVTNGLRPIFRAPTMLVASLVFSFLLNPTLALVFLVAVPLLSIVLYLILKKLAPLYRVMQKTLDKVNSVVQENLIAIRVVKSFAREDYECEKFEEVNQEYRSTAQRSYGLAALNNPFFQLTVYATTVCILWIGGNIMHSGEMQVGELTGFLSYVMQLLNALMMISGVFLMLTRSITSAQRIMEVLDEPLDITDNGDKNAVVRHGEIQFNDVSFRYSSEAEEDVLSHINLHILSGQTIGIVGGTGSAKSSLVQLIPRLYDITAGELLVDGRDVKDYSLVHLRDSISMVLQKNTLFSGTVKENLMWGNEQATQADLDWACKISNADEVIRRLSKGYDTLIEQGGTNVSGGQRQRLCIARALLKKPKVLIFDDSTSAVDTATEASIRDGLQNSLPDTTKIIISQRISSVEQADQIVVLNNGTINAIGTHQELFQHNDIYRDMYEAQQKGVMS